LRTADLGRQSFAFRVGELDPIGDRLEPGVVGESIDVDPEELSIAELLQVDLGQVDRPVVAVRIEQARCDGAQLTRASSAAAMTAITATRY
jgi:hypothetical protein